ncbi:MAG: hypothetical protein JNL81_07175 [Hyphomonadaceae bacterium]|nr:hypothetical protein [Hyphomonadaceae bacterium]
MSEAFALAYADNVHREAVDEFASSLLAVAQYPDAISVEFERQLETFLVDMNDAAIATRELIQEIDALIR